MQPAADRLACPSASNCARTARRPESPLPIEQTALCVAPAPSTTVRAEAHGSVCSGRPCPASDGASSGREPTVAPVFGAREPLGIEYDQFRTDLWASNIELQQDFAERTVFVLRA